MNLIELSEACHENAVQHGFYDDHDELLNYLEVNRPDLYEHYMTTWRLARLMLITTEVAEAAEEVRKGRYPGEELADIFIRLGDTSRNFNVELDKEVRIKMRKNADRERMHGKLA